MKCLTPIKIQVKNIKYGDILIYSDCQAFLIVKDCIGEFEAKAIQIFNNGNEKLGEIDYSDKSLDQLVERLIVDYGKPEKIVNMKDVSIQF